MKKLILIILLALPLLALPALEAFADKSEIPRMDRVTLLQRMEQGDVVVIDVRKEKDWSNRQGMIKGSVREDPDAVSEWSKKYDKEVTVVLYCA